MYGYKKSKKSKKLIINARLSNATKGADEKLKKALKGADEKLKKKKKRMY